jgi:hypothetical protein
VFILAPGFLDQLSKNILSGSDDRVNKFSRKILTGMPTPSGDPGGIPGLSVSLDDHESNEASDGCHPDHDEVDPE